MIFTNIYLNNIFCFKDCNVELTYKRQNPDSSIEDEFLKGRPRFNYKKVCILTGANASGKTSFGRALCAIQNFICNTTNKDSIFEIINDNSKESKFSVEFVSTENYFLYRYTVTMLNDQITSQHVSSAQIGINDSCKVVRDKLDLRIKKNKNNRYGINMKYDINTESKEIVRAKKDLMDSLSFSRLGWYYLDSENTERSSNIKYLNKDIFSKILKTFDPSIKSISDIPSEDGKEGKSNSGYVIRFMNGDTVFVDSDGDVTNKDRLSKGAYSAIPTSDFIAQIIHDGHSHIYYLDEHLTYCHTEVEQSILNLIIDKLGYDCQFFYTTHNYDILEMNLPIHSYAFFSKETNTKIVMAEEHFKKNDRTLLNYVKNDYFMTIPDTEEIDDLLFDYK